MSIRGNFSWGVDPEQTKILASDDEEIGLVDSQDSVCFKNEL